MAKQVSEEKWIKVAAGTLWRWWTELERWPRWQPETEAARWIEGEPWAEGSRFELLRRGPFPVFHRIPGAGARRFVGQVRSVAHESLLVWELTPTTASWFGPELVQSVRFDSAPNGTTLHLSLGAHGLGPTLLGPLLGGPLHAQASATLDALAHAVAPIARRE